MGLPGLIQTLWKRISAPISANTEGTKSAFPAETPPVVIIISEPRSIDCCSRSLICSFTSFTWKLWWMIIPERRSEASRYGPFVLAILGPSLLSNSLPVVTMLTFGGLYTFIDFMPLAIADIMTCGSIVLPFSKITSPALKSSPANLTLRPFETLSVMTKNFLPSRSIVVTCSTGTTLSKPLGTTAPVIIS